MPDRTKMVIRMVPTGIATFYNVSFENVSIGSLEECIEFFTLLKKKSSESMDVVWSNA